MGFKAGGAVGWSGGSRGMRNVLVEVVNGGNGPTAGVCGKIPMRVCGCIARGDGGSGGKPSGGGEHDRA